MLHNYEYLRMIVSSLHVILIILSIIVMWKYSQKVIISKAPPNAKDSFLFISNFTYISIILFAFIFMVMNIGYVTNFFNRIPKYVYLIPLLVSCMIFLLLLISVNKKQE